MQLFMIKTISQKKRIFESLIALVNRFLNLNYEELLLLSLVYFLKINI